MKHTQTTICRSCGTFDGPFETDADSIVVCRQCAAYKQTTGHYPGSVSEPEPISVAGAQVVSDLLQKVNPSITEVEIDVILKAEYGETDAARAKRLAERIK